MGAGSGLTSSSASSTTSPCARWMTPSAPARSAPSAAAAAAPRAHETTIGSAQNHAARRRAHPARRGRKRRRPAHARRLRCHRPGGAGLRLGQRMGTIQHPRHRPVPAARYGRDRQRRLPRRRQSPQRRPGGVGAAPALPVAEPDQPVRNTASRGSAGVARRPPAPSRPGPRLGRQDGGAAADIGQPDKRIGRRGDQVHPPPQRLHQSGEQARRLRRQRGAMRRSRDDSVGCCLARAASSAA